MSRVEKIAKRKVVEAATRQSQRAQAITASLRAHGWRWTFNGTERVPSDADYRRREAQRALDHARIIVRDAEAVLSWVEAWARQEGVVTDELKAAARSAIAVKRSTGILEEKVRRARDAGASLREIAAAVGMTPEGVRQLLKRTSVD